MTFNKIFGQKSFYPKSQTYSRWPFIIKLEFIFQKEHQTKICIQGTLLITMKRSKQKVLLIRNGKVLCWIFVLC